MQDKEKEDRSPEIDGMRLFDCVYIKIFCHQNKCSVLVCQQVQVQVQVQMVRRNYLLS